jgi:hypothetical protein
LRNASAKSLAFSAPAADWFNIAWITVSWFFRSVCHLTHQETDFVFRFDARIRGLRQGPRDGFEFRDGIGARGDRSPWPSRRASEASSRTSRDRRGRCRRRWRRREGQKTTPPIVNHSKEETAGACTSEDLAQAIMRQPASDENSVTT